MQFGLGPGISLLVVALAGCADTATLPIERQLGANPVLPTPVHSLIPTVKVAEATGWPQGAKPTPASGWQVSAFATGLDHPRWLLVLPNGDVLVAETNAPERPEEGRGLRGWATRMVMKKAGAGVPSANRITLLRDADGDSVAEIRSVFLEGLNSPFGMALVGNDLYVADTDAVLRFPYRRGATRIEAKGEKLADLPAGPRNHHWTKNLIASRDGSKLYVTVGSNSNAADNGMDEEVGRAAIWEMDLQGRKRIFASGLRNANGMAFEPRSGALWAVVNERDELGSDLVPDYLTSVKDGAFYGWPYSYYGQHVDERVKPQRPDLVAKAVKPDYALGSHVAALGLAYSSSPEGMFIGEHGSWNRSPPSGYEVVFVPFANGRPTGPAQKVLTGFLADGKARGRPVGVAIDRSGALLVADDVGNIVWRVTKR